MATWYLCKISYQKEDEVGSLKTITETYLIDAVSYTEAETRMYDLITHKEFQLINLTKMKLSEVFEKDSDAETWFRLKVFYIAFDEKTQKEKKTPYWFLVKADNPRHAYTLLIEHLGELNDYVITDVNITTISEIFPYESHLDVV